MRSFHPHTGICFFKIQSSKKLSRFLREVPWTELEITAVDLAHWFEFGCIYVDGVRTRNDTELNAGQVIRLHTRGKRFPVPENLRDLLILNDDDFAVIDKPAGLPVHPTVDNFVENAKFQLEKELSQQLYTTHRLDIPTQGLLVFAKSPDAQKRFNKILANRQIEKIYGATAERELTLGLKTHYIDPDTRVPRTIESAPREGWWKCDLEILAVEGSNGYFRHKVRLLTGKTHQIRAQFAALGAPLLGDRLYGSSTPFPPKNPRPESIALTCEELKFRFRARSIDLRRSQGNIEL